MQTVELIKLIKINLNTVTDKAYLDNAPTLPDITDATQYPYVVFELLNDTTDELENIITLTMDLWDYNRDSTRIETLGDDIESAFNLLNKPCGNNLPTFYRNTRQKIYDINLEFKRRQLQFTIQNYSINDFNKNYI